MAARGIEGGGVGNEISSGAELRAQMEQFLDLVRRGAPADTVEKARVDLLQRFQMVPAFPHFMRKIAEQAATSGYQQFRLPGKDRVVQDRRDHLRGEHAAHKTAEEQAGRKTEQKKDDGEAKKTEKRAAGAVDAEADKTKEAGKKTGADKAGELRGTGATSLSAEASKLERILNAVERLLIAVFEEGAQVATPSEDGRAHLAAKTVEEWRGFFAQFLERVIPKKVLLAEIQEFLFRGLVQKGSKAIVISDLTLQGGKVEKFVRFNVIAQALERLKQLAPGETFGREALEGLTGEELVYLALAASRGTELVTSTKPTLGKFLDGQLEARTRSELGLPIEAQLEERAKMLRKRKGIFGLKEPTYPEEELPSQFIPWWHWGNLGKPTRSRTTTILFYASLLAVALIGIGVMTARLLQ